MPIGIDINKAKEVHKDHIRAVRNPLLNEKDVEYMRALESGDSQKIQEIATEKQLLRDATKIVDSVEITGNSILEVTNELKSVWDETLLGPNPLTK